MTVDSDAINSTHKFLDASAVDDDDDDDDDDASDVIIQTTDRAALGTELKQVHFHSVFASCGSRGL